MPSPSSSPSSMVAKNALSFVTIVTDSVRERVNV